MAVGGEVVLDFSKITFADVLTKLFRIFASPSANINVLWAIIPAYAN